jgi:hypothetical protein
MGGLVGFKLSCQESLDTTLPKETKKHGGRQFDHRVSLIMHWPEQLVL